MLSVHFLSESCHLVWYRLTRAEKVVVACICLIPLWWLLGWSYLFLLLAGSVYLYEFCSQGKIRLSAPHPFVILMVFYGLHSLISEYFYASLHQVSMSIRDWVGAVNSWIATGLVLWYIQSKPIRTRPLVVAGAFAFVVALMLVFWGVIYFVWQQADYSPTRSLFGILAGKGEVYEPGVGNNNFLIPYFANDHSIPGMVRYVFFFYGPESLALALCFICLLALELKHPWAAVALFSGAAFLLLLSGTRSVWIVLPTVLAIHWLLKAGQLMGSWLVCALIAVTSFTTLSIPSVTNQVLTQIDQTTSATAELRGNSTEVRNEIYQRTWSAILDADDTRLLFGHVNPGETVLPGYAPAKVGSHSFYLGSLLYRKGLMGTGIFLAFWAALIQWFYQTRRGRPSCCWLMLAVFSVTFCVMEWESVVTPLLLVMATLRESWT
jgi:hypothetical protein